MISPASWKMDTKWAPHILLVAASQQAGHRLGSARFIASGTGGHRVSSPVSRKRGSKLASQVVKPSSLGGNSGHLATHTCFTHCLGKEF